MLAQANAACTFVRVGNVWEELFGRRVKALRVAKGWTQGQLAERMTVTGHSMHQTTIAKLENASRPTNVGEINAIATIFDVSMTALFDYSTEGQINLEVAGLENRLATISAEKTRLEQRLAALNTEFASVETLRQELEQQIEDEREAEEQHRREVEQDAYDEMREREAMAEGAAEVYGDRGDK